MPVSIVCETTASAGEQSGHVSVQVKGGGIGQSAQRFRYQVTINPTGHKRDENCLARINNMQEIYPVFIKGREVFDHFKTTFYTTE